MMPSPNIQREMRRDLRRVTAALLVAFAAVALGAVFWGVLRADSLLARQDNARNVIRQQLIARGAIYDRAGEVLAISVPDARGVMQRRYPDDSVTGAVGYYSFTYGTAGIEAGYDNVLRGEGGRSDWQRALDRVLHRVQTGSDIRTTIDLDVQRAVAAAFGARSGAAIAVDVPSGRVLGMVSAPGYDPNMLDQRWDALTEDRATSPLLNRVTAGLYQPGGALQSVVLAAMLATNPELINSGADILNAPLADARDSVRADGLTLHCLDSAPQSGPLTLAEAYVHGCPAPFARAFDGPLTPERLWERFEVSGLLSAPDLPGFQTDAGPPAAALRSDMDTERLTAELVGQGALTVTPLQIVQFVAAIANRGNGVPLHLVSATREPGASAWQTVPAQPTRPALLRADVAAGLRLAMLQAAARSAYVQQAQVAQGPGSDRVVYGHAGLAYGGPDETPYAWFLGFLDLTEDDQTRAIAVVVVIEDEPDPGAAARVASAAFGAAVRE